MSDLKWPDAKDQTNRNNLGGNITYVDLFFDFAP